jgi:hypothetical protein
VRLLLLPTAIPQYACHDHGDSQNNEDALNEDSSNHSQDGCHDKDKEESDENSNDHRQDSSGVFKCHCYSAPSSKPANWMGFILGTIYTSASVYALNSTTHMLSVTVTLRGFPKNFSKITSSAPA